MVTQTPTQPVARRAHRRPLRPSLGFALMMLAGEGLLSVIAAALGGSRGVSIAAVVVAFVFAFASFRHAVRELTGASVNDVAAPVWQPYTGLAIVAARIVAAVMQVWR